MQPVSPSGRTAGPASGSTTRSPTNPGPRRLALPALLDEAAPPVAGDGPLVGRQDTEVQAVELAAISAVAAVHLMNHSHRPAPPGQGPDMPR